MISKARNRRVITFMFFVCVFLLLVSANPGFCQADIELDKPVPCGASLTVNGTEKEIKEMITGEQNGTILVFFHERCKACLHELEAIADANFLNFLQENNIVVDLVSLSNSLSDEFMENENIRDIFSYGTLCYGNWEELKKLLNVNSIPVVVFTDFSGVVREKFVGTKPIDDFYSACRVLLDIKNQKICPVKGDL